MNEKNGLFSEIARSGFVRSVFTRVLAIFIIVAVIIAATAFYSFTGEIRRSILSDRQKRLAAVESTISGRMGEIASIAYNVGKDPVFYLEPVEDTPASGRDISKTLDRYLVGNNFIEHLAFCRVAEPDTIYVSKGERSLSEFYMTAFGMDKAAAEGLIAKIHGSADIDMRVWGEGEDAYFTYSYPLPELSTVPRAHVLMMIPISKVRPLLEALLINSNGVVAVFDAGGREIYSVGEHDGELDLLDYAQNGAPEEEYKCPSGERYVLQKVVAESNSWIYVCATRHSDTLSGLANKQIEFLVIVLLTLVAAIVLMLASVIIQYKPISKLAAQVAGGGEGAAIDERALLSDTIATLKDDSEQKKKYETAFYEAEAASKAKSAFLSSMSHDIRTPMNAIIGMTAIARKHIGDEAYVDECLEKVQASSEYLLDIINNVLDMSRIESGRIPLSEETVVIPALLDSVSSLMASSVEAKKQTLDMDMSGIAHALVVGDSIHIVQVFMNILSNAVKFTPECGNISLHVREEAVDTLRGRYIFTFTDTGIGIPPEFIDKVFDTFTRAGEPQASRTEGTGLGMAIAKKLTELMGGTISCESELGRGTAFTVVLTMNYANEERDGDAFAPSHKAGRDRSHEEAAIPDLRGKHILLVEDNAMNREIASRIMFETGADIVEANDGKEAVEAFMDHPEGFFDLILMDIQMPVMNGYEATAAIRALGRADSMTVPIFAMTANTFDEDVRNVKEAGMKGHIGKPYTPDMLYKALADALC